MNNKENSSEHARISLRNTNNFRKGDETSIRKGTRNSTQTHHPKLAERISRMIQRCSMTGAIVNGGSGYLQFPLVPYESITP